jgi:hypothetical protein
MFMLSPDSLWSIEPLASPKTANPVGSRGVEHFWDPGEVRIAGCWNVKLPALIHYQ